MQMIDGEIKKAAKAAAEANDAMEAERGRSREALRALQQQTQVNMSVDLPVTP